MGQRECSFGKECVYQYMMERARELEQMHRIEPKKRTREWLRGYEKNVRLFTELATTVFGCVLKSVDGNGDKPCNMSREISWFRGLITRGQQNLVDWKKNLRPETEKAISSFFNLG